mmetsp:Transcript_97139/g.302425  ORF Transcript_97139/g.302425 Transcript_97139/m.302425 type:complete len:365 (+) Transcript_97139:804-1898(+)
MEGHHAAGADVLALRGRHRPAHGQHGGGHEPGSRHRDDRHQDGPERPDLLAFGRQPPRRALTREAQLLARLRRVLRHRARGRPLAVHRALDAARRAALRAHRGRPRALRQVGHARVGRGQGEGGLWLEQHHRLLQREPAARQARYLRGQAPGGHPRGAAQPRRAARLLTRLGDAQLVPLGGHRPGQLPRHLRAALVLRRRRPRVPAGGRAWRPLLLALRPLPHPRGRRAGLPGPPHSQQAARRWPRRPRAPADAHRQGVLRADVCAPGRGRLLRHRLLQLPAPRSQVDAPAPTGGRGRRGPGRHERARRALHQRPKRRGGRAEASGRASGPGAHRLQALPVAEALAGRRRDDCRQDVVHWRARP